MRRGGHAPGRPVTAGRPGPDYISLPGPECEVRRPGARRAPRLTDGSDASPLWRAELALRRAQLAGDVAVLDRLVDDALVFTGPDGAVYGKADDLDAHRAGWVRIVRLVPSEERVQRFGDVAVVSVRMEMAGTFRGAAFAGSFRYTRVWCRRAEGWRVVAGHVSAVATAGEA